MKTLRFALVCAAALAAQPTLAAPIEAGALMCEVSASIAMIVMQRQDMRCTFLPANGGPEVFYKGRIDAYGIALGAVARGKLAWAVLAPSTSVPPGALAGSYSGLGAQASAGGGVGVNILTGDNDSSFTLQPIAVEGHVGVNVAAGVSRVTLRAAPETRPRRFWDRWDD
ncbi:DUF992 domain-containing protein [Rhodoblastus acidophilus]|jgi:hypothetical protein|uniref:DUF992 domain-containing protein n=1 Tax=Rhodoblastus acidophilus TaxID=1074 RepID=A0A6N8DNQ3_RHOAC|nr:DUF992 domain-containing protein [Rhodoblastus acidophilus]MCW2275214.1 hypothetical protein [Rhodoblastus acidophilus]MTV32180.1 DUF992 domain-containing protein [Rhodoblastus acidophilus]